jgi:hypothetical protein
VSLEIYGLKEQNRRRGEFMRGIMNTAVYIRKHPEIMLLAVNRVLNEQGWALKTVKDISKN